VAKKNAGLVHAPVLNAGRERTTLLAKTLALAVNVAQNIVLAAMAKQLIGRVAGQPPRPIVPIEDAPLLVHKVNAIAHVVQNFFVESWIVRYNPDRLFYRLAFIPFRQILASIRFSRLMNSD
jgi:hypothetical protein